jgi:hypothetical protein
VRTRRKPAPIKGALIAQATLALQKKFIAFTPA